MSDAREGEDRRLKRFLAIARPVVEGRLGGLVFRHGSASFRGEPDASLTALGGTLWLEAKVGVAEGRSTRYRADGRSLQKVNMRRLGKSGLARYLVWCDGEAGAETRIVHPNRVGDGVMEDYEWAAKGTQHTWALERLLRLMRGEP